MIRINLNDFDEHDPSLKEIPNVDLALQLHIIFGLMVEFI